ncbi:Protein kinase domain [Carpediemonas membranifera]|uniref:Protein kinase domain n=1 Tax=Carpediemonas membranifera TaxID=201153 RepID=A0A8J6AS18_9EUKA|nr:Protein kinase domain [Carpediemonas membranifera]|eukprot:KAG9390030.1 Protein kinase domain [Carpediemonas membranifera]
MYSDELGCFESSKLQEFDPDHITVLSDVAIDVADIAGFVHALLRIGRRVPKLLTVSIVSPNTVVTLGTHVKCSPPNASVELILALWQAMSAPVVRPSTFIPHEGAVQCADMSPDGGLVATCGDGNKFIRLFDATGALIRRLYGHVGHSWRLQFSPDGQTLLSASYDGSAMLWNVATGKVVKTLEHDDTVWYACFSADGSRVATASHDRTLKIWDSAGTLLKSMKCRGSVKGVAFSTDDSCVVSLCFDGHLTMWSLIDSEPVWETESSISIEARFTPCGRAICGCSKNYISLVNAADGELVWSIEAHTASIQGIAITPGGLIVSGSADGTVKIWTLAGRLVQTVQCQASVNSVNATQDGFIAALKSCTAETFAVVHPQDENTELDQAFPGVATGPTETYMYVERAYSPADLARVLLHVAASGRIPRNFDMRLEDPDGAVNMNYRGALTSKFGLPGAVYKMWNAFIAHTAEIRTVREDHDERTAELRTQVERTTRTADYLRVTLTRDHEAQLQRQETALNAKIAVLDATILEQRHAMSRMQQEHAAELASQQADFQERVLAMTDEMHATQSAAVELKTVMAQQAEDDLARVREELHDQHAVELQRQRDDSDSKRAALLGTVHAHAQSLAMIQAEMTAFCCQEGILTGVFRAAKVSAALHGHPLLTGVTRPARVVEIAISASHLYRSLAQAREALQSRTQGYTCAIAVASAAIKQKKANLKSVRVQFRAATALMKASSAFESAANLTPDITAMQATLEQANAEVSRAPQAIAARLVERYADLERFLCPDVREVHAWASRVVAEGLDTRAEKQTVAQLSGFIAEARAHLAAFAVADDVAKGVSEKCGDSDVYSIHSEVAELEAAAKAMEPLETLAGTLKTTEARLAAKRGRRDEVAAILTRVPPQLERLCPELNAISAPGEPVVAKLCELGLRNLIDLPEMRFDLSMSDFVIVDDIPASRTLCQVVQRRGETLFAKTYQLHSVHQRRMCDNEAGILSHMVHSPAVPQLRHAMVNLANKTCTLVTKFIPCQRPSIDGPADLAMLVHGLIAAVYQLHSAGITHRGIKPDNILFCEGHSVLVGFESALNVDTEQDQGARAFMAPEEGSLSEDPHRRYSQWQAADVYRVAVTALALSAADYTSFSATLLHHSTASQANLEHNDRVEALIAELPWALPEALRTVFAGMLAPWESRWSVRRALADECFVPSENVDTVPAFDPFAGDQDRIFALAVEESRLQALGRMSEAVEVDLAEDVAESLVTLGQCEADLTAVPVMMHGDDAALALPSLITSAGTVAVRDRAGEAISLFRDGTLMLTPGALNVPLDSLRPVLLGLGRLLQLMLVHGVRLPASMVSYAWLAALNGDSLDMATLMPFVSNALCSSLDAARLACPLSGVDESCLKTYQREVEARVVHRMSVVHDGLIAGLSSTWVALIDGLTPVELRALLVQQSGVSANDIMALLKFPGDCHEVQKAIETALEDAETRRVFVEYCFGGKLPCSSATVVLSGRDRSVRGDHTGRIHLPRLVDPVRMRRAALQSRHTYMSHNM